MICIICVYFKTILYLIQLERNHRNIKKMGVLIKECLFIAIMLSWQVNNLAFMCLDTCVCNRITNLCQPCFYNITLREISMNQEILLCCHDDIKLSSWPPDYANKTYTQVSASYDSACNDTTANFDVPLLDAYSLHITNNNFIQIKIKIKRQNLREIDLSSNKLQYVSSGLFNNFLNLRKLVLSRNNIMNIFQESFNGLSKLESLDLSENNLTVLTNVFTPLKNLQHLNLSRNNIEFIHENYFNNWLLQHLDVSHNNLKKLEPGALQLLPNLARLLLTDNPHLGITQLDSQLLVGIGRRLQQIDASRTGLYQVPEAFTHSVRFLSLVGNRISAVRCGDFDSYPLLQSLDFSDNKVVSIEDDSLGRLEMLLFLNINKNLLTAVPKSLPDELKYLSINNNLIKNLSIPDFKNLPNLRILLLQNNSIRFIQDHVFDDLLSLEMLDLSNNPIQTLSWSTFDGPLSLRDLRLCYLNLSVTEQVGSFPMSSPESVQMLHLQSSPGLARQFLADSAALAAFSHLQYLDLRMNNLSEIRNDLLFYLVQLKTLRLHGNQINCSAELWLKDWMNWNKSITNDETCYYSTSEAKPEISKYNCTFPETFTISDSLPPVNLYSTEMINKLLRYYGYLNNKTEKNFKRNNDKKKYDFNVIKFNSTMVNENLPKDVKNHVAELKKNENRISDNNLTETTVAKNKEISKILDHNNIQNDQTGVDHRYLNIEAYFSLSSHNSKKEDVDANVLHKNKSRSGKRLNTPLNITKKSENLSNETKATLISKYLDDTENNTAYETDASDPNYKTVYSPYRLTDTSYAQYIGTLAVSGLILLSLVLWLSFRMRYRRRRVPVIDAQAEDQIEVSNISGGVLW